MKLFYIVFIILIIPFALLSQSNIQGTYKFRNYSIAQGLPSSETYDIEQDNEGNIWFATDRGVVKYNSRSFKTYTKKDGLIDDVVLQIYKDPFGKLWFLTIENRLCYYENGKIYPYKYNDQILKNISHKKSHPDKDILIKKNGTLFLSIRPIGIIEIDINGKNKRLYTKTDNLTVKTIQNKSIWSLSFININKNHNSLDIQFKPDNQPQTSILKQKFRFNKIISTIDNKSCYLMYANSVYDLNQNKKILEFTNSTIIQIKKIDSKLWVSSIKKGVGIYKLDNKPKLLRTFLKNYSVTDIFKDNNSGYWFSTLEKGVFYIPSIEIQNFNRRNSLFLDDIKNVNGLNGNIYIGYIGDNYQSIQNNKWYNHIGNGTAYSQFGYSGEHLIRSSPIGTYLDHNKISNLWFKDLYSGINYSIGIGNGVLKIYPNGKSEKLTDFEAGLHFLHEIMYDEKNDIWIGGSKGLYKFDNHKILPYKQSEFKFRVTDLNYSKKWGKLIATRENGIFCLSNNKISKLKISLISNSLNCLFNDKNNCLWVGTNKGVNILIKSKDGKITIKYISKEHGILSNEITSIFVDDKNAWIGTKSGLSKIELKKLNTVQYDSKIKLSSILLNNKKNINLSKKILIPHFEDVVTLKFGAINFITKGLYKYRFQPSSNWNYITKPEILLYNPEDGIYNLEVSFLNDNNKWSSIQKIVNFEITPPFWKTIYFRLIILIIIVYCVYYLIQFKKKQFETKRKLLILEQKALFAQMNPHFIFNTLNSIQSFLIYNENDKAEYFLSKFSKLLRETLHVSRNSTISLKKEFNILEKYLELEQMRFSNKFQWKIVYNMSIDDLKLRIPNMLIQPYIENSIKHGFTEKRSDFIINIKVTLIDDYSLKCEVIDNGIGRSASILKKSDDINSKDHTSYGEKITKERLKTYNKSKTSNFGVQIFDIELNGESKGTKVEIIIPILKNDKNRYS